MTACDFDTLGSSARFLHAVGEGRADDVFRTAAALPKQDRPRWIETACDGGLRLFSIPWAWHMDDEGRELSLVSEPAFGIDVCDPDWDEPLRLFSEGRTDLAGRAVRELVRGHGIETFGPLKRAFAALVLVADAESSARQDWDDWLEFEARLRTSAPDAAAAFGSRLLQQGRFEEATTWLLEAVRRGLPYLTASFRALSLGFGQLEDDAMLRRIAKALTTAEPGTPFTVLFLPRHDGCQAYSSASLRIP